MTPAKPMGPLALRAIYTMSELAVAMGISRRRLKRLLRLSEVKVFSRGRLSYVPLSEIEAKLDVLWDSIRSAEQLRHEDYG